MESRHDRVKNAHWPTMHKPEQRVLHRAYGLSESGLVLAHLRCLGAAVAESRENIVGSIRRLQQHPPVNSPAPGNGLCAQLISCQLLFPHQQQTKLRMYQLRRPCWAHMQTALLNSTNAHTSLLIWSMLLLARSKRPWDRSGAAFLALLAAESAAEPALSAAELAASPTSGAPGDKQERLR